MSWLDTVSLLMNGIALGGGVYFAWRISRALLKLRKGLHDLSLKPRKPINRDIWAMVAVRANQQGLLIADELAKLPGECINCGAYLEGSQSTCPNCATEHAY